MYAWQFAKAQHTARMNGTTPFVSMQNHYNLVYREEEREMIPQCIDQGVAITPWSPLARGFLAGNRRPSDRQENANAQTVRVKSDPQALRMYYSEGDFAVVDRVVELAGKHGVQPAQIALAWMLHKPFVAAPIIGASKMEQLDQLLGAMDVKLDAAEIAHLEEPYQPHRIAGHT
jgi:aryl-alcohol dehydrogenase (NADP+)